MVCGFDCGAKRDLRIQGKSPGTVESSNGGYCLVSKSQKILGRGFRIFGGLRGHRGAMDLGKLINTTWVACRSGKNLVS